MVPYPSGSGFLPEARGSGVEAVFSFLGSGVDSRGEKGEKGSEGRVLGSGARIEFLIRAKTPFAFAFVRQRGAVVAAG